MQHAARLAGLVTVAVVAGCTDGRPSTTPAGDPTASLATSTAPPTTAATAVADAGYPACEAALKIKADPGRFDAGDIIDAAYLGARSTNTEFAREARVVGDFTTAADLALRSGDPADQIRAKIRGYLDGLVEDCRTFGYLRR
ncbi:hypothetical protein O7628_15860 [Micromonospora sp. WMMD956]|uniref:hypothetical protein n=1 Tax=Micromonospora TaxID=1873 RepID=UPI00241609BE|nr:hypothetical protein [Micromonospora sp. WMMD956]MDG4816973.1 hypothetical protein [Micromonospora sp. WMMD956]